MIDRPGWKRGTRGVDAVEPPTTETIIDNPNFGVPDFDKFPTTSSESAFEDLNALIGEFANNIGEGCEVGLYVGSSKVPFQLEQLALRRELVIFNGFDPSGNSVVAVEHYTCLSLRLVQLKKTDASSATGFFADS